MSDAPPLAEQVDEKRAAYGRTVAERLASKPEVKKFGDERATVYAVSGFLTPEECKKLMAMIDAFARPSDLFETDGIEEFRTSSSGDLNRYDPLVSRIDRRIDALLGLPNAHGETIQGQRYAPGQFFRTHADFFYIGESYWPEMEKCGGQRTWTAMVYLNEPEQGGGTRFDRLSIEMQPETGMLLAWDNMDARGAPNEFVMHEGCTVDAGTKYVVTKWYRERVWFQPTSDAMSLAAGGAPDPSAATYRLAEQADAIGIALVLEEAGFELDRKILRRNLKDMLASGLGPVIAEQNDAVVAFCCPTISQPLHLDSKVGRISSMIITPGEDGEKIAEQLVREAEKHLHAHGCRLIEVTTSDERSDAHAFYERLGYQRTSARFIKNFD